MPQAINDAQRYLLSAVSMGAALSMAGASVRGSDAWPNVGSGSDVGFAGLALASGAPEVSAPGLRSHSCTLKCRTSLSLDVVCKRDCSED